jgi:hypothetical protein
MVQWSRREVTIGCGALVAGLLVGCQRSQRPQPPPQPALEIETLEGQPSLQPTIEDLRGILDRRAAALERDDEQAFLADLDRSNEGLIKRERRLFANLRQFELRDFRLLADQAFDIPDDGGDTYTFAPVIQITHLTADSAPGGVAPAEAFQYRLAKRNGGPVVTDITAITERNYDKLRSNAEALANAPWNTSALNVVNVGNVWLAGDDSVPDLERYAAAAERQAGDVEALWGDRPRFPGSVLFLTRRMSNFRTWFDFGSADYGEGGIEPERLEGFERPLRGVRKNGEQYQGQYAGSRIVVNLANVELAGDDPDVVMRHELVHAVTAKVTSVDLRVGGARGSLVSAPRWAMEGSALWIDRMEQPERQAEWRAVVADGVRAGKFDGTPPATETFYAAADISFNYAVSASIFDLIERDHGKDSAVEFCAQAIQHNDALSPLVEQRGFDTMCQQIVGTDADAFLREWSGFVRAGA